MLFPNFTLKSVTCTYAFVLIFVYIITEIVYASNKDMSWGCVLYYSGAKFTYAITRKGHLHRLILPIILHSGFFHIFWNILSLFMIGFSVEKALGKWYKYLALLVFGGIGGNIFSAMVSAYQIAVGASTSLYALTGYMIIWIYRNWSLLGRERTRFIIFMLVIMAFSLLDGLTMTSSGIDNYGHLGGLIYGILIGNILYNTVTIQ
jgi:rhomboid protease GluP